MQLARQIAVADTSRKDGVVASMEPRMSVRLAAGGGLDEGLRMR